MIIKSLRDNFAYFFIKTYVVGAHIMSLEWHRQGDSNEQAQHRFL